MHEGAEEGLQTSSNLRARTFAAGHCRDALFRAGRCSNSWMIATTVAGRVVLLVAEPYIVYFGPPLLPRSDDAALDFSPSLPVFCSAQI